MPEDVLLQWNSGPSKPMEMTDLSHAPCTRHSDNTPPDTTRPNNTCKNNNNSEVSSSVSLGKEGELSAFDSVFPFFIPGVDRQAKMMATLRIRTESAAQPHRPRTGMHRAASTSTQSNSRPLKQSTLKTARPHRHSEPDVVTHRYGLSSSSEDRTKCSDETSLREFCIPVEKVQLGKKACGAVVID